MVAFTKINDFVDYLGEGAFNLGSDTIKLALSNTAPASETSNPTADGNGVLANVTQIAYTNVSGGQPTMASVTWTQSSGTSTFNAADEVITASGGAIPTFQYIYMYSDTPTSPADPLIGLWDNGSAIDLADGESLTFDITTNILTLA